jgi:hypothetical protein
MKYDWQLLFSSDGHKYFLDKLSGKYAVADGSGYFPNETDDGVLWLDLQKPLTLDLWNGTFISVSVPLEADVSTGATVREASKLIDKFKFCVRTTKKEYFKDLSKLISRIKEGE